MRPIAVYKITNNINGKMYIGQTMRPERRFSEHTWRCSKSKILSEAIKKYGKESFTFSILCLCPDKTYADNIEIGLIKGYDTTKTGYNICLGGEGFGSGEAHPCFGRVASSEERKIKSESKKGALNPMFGKQNTHEQKEKIRQSLLGRDITWGDKISAAKKGVRAPNQKLVPMVAKKDGELFYFPSVTDCANIIGVAVSLVYKWSTNKHASTSGWIIGKASDGDDIYANIRHIDYVKPKIGCSKNVVCRKSDTTLYFNSLRDAAKYLDVNYKTIRRWVRGQNISSSGWTVEYCDAH